LNVFSHSNYTIHIVAFLHCDILLHDIVTPLTMSEEI